MAADDLTRIEARLAREVAARSKPGEAARGLLKAEMTPAEYLGALAGAEEFPDAVKFLAHALPRREAVWWACLCARKAAAGAKPRDGDTAQAEAEARALAAAGAWAADMSEENRRAAAAAAAAAGYGTPAGCAAVAAFWSGGSLAPPGLPAVPPGDHLTAHGASSSVLLAAIVLGPEDAPATFRAFLADGLDVARGRDRWADAPAPAPPPAPSPRPAPARAMAAAPAPREPAPRRNLNWD